jgi:hypothetical protein
VKSFNILKMSVILLGFTGALLLSPASKAQEVTSDHFMEAGVLNVYEPVAGKAAPAAVKQMPAAVQARKQQTGSASSLQRTAKRGSSLLAKPDAQAVTEKRKPTPTELKKP